MRAPMRRPLRVLHWAGWASALAALALAVRLVLANGEQRRTVADQIEQGQQVKLFAAQQHLENYIAEIATWLRLIAADPAVVALSRASHDHIQRICEANYARRRLEEIYVIERGFDGSRRPFMTFERSHGAAPADQVHTPEREAHEHAAHRAHLARFEDDAAPGVLISAPVELCVGQPGLVVSVPIRGPDGLVGLVAGMVSAGNIADVLEESTLGNLLLLVNSRGAMFGCRDFRPDHRAWFDAALDRTDVAGFFARRSGRFPVGAYQAIYGPVRLPGDDRWYVTLLYDERAALRASGAPGPAEGWLGAAVAALLGGAVLFLCRLTPALVHARGQAQARAGELLASEERFRTLVETMNEGLAVQDERGVLTYANDRFLRILGRTRSEVLGRPVHEVLFDGASRELFDHQVELRRSGGSEPYEITLAGQGGRPVHVLVSPRGLFDGKGRYRGSFAVVLDVTEWKAALEAQRTSEGRLEAFTDHTQAVIYMKDLAGRFVMVNRRFEELFHVSRKDVVGRTDFDLWPREQAEAFRANDAEVLRLDRALEFEEVAGHDDGPHTYISLKFPLHDAAGAACAVCGVSTDITERKRTERELQATNELLERVLATTNVLIAYLDREFNFVRVNRAYAAAGEGQPPEWYVGRNHFALYPNEENQRIFQRVVDTGEPCSYDAKPFEYAGHPERGLTYWDWDLQPVRGPDGRVEGVLLCLVNVTERVRAEETARQRQAELAHVARLGTVGELASNLAHELNQPLAAIVNYIQAGLERARAGRASPEELRKDLENAAAQAHRAGAIVQRIRGFVRKRAPQQAPTDVNALVREATALLAAEVRRCRADLALELAEALPPVAVDAIQIEQVIVNLVFNALEALGTQPPGARRVSVRTGPGPAGGVEVTVRDTGAGLPAEGADRLFEPFFTTKPNGMGLGLKICRTIVEAHGGRIWAESDPAGGAVLRFTLPAEGDGHDADRVHRG